jgi:hypothetical protein
MRWQRNQGETPQHREPCFPQKARIGRFLWNTFMRQFRQALEAEPSIIVWVTYKNAALGSPVSQPGQAFLHQSFSYTLLLVFRQDGNGADAVPVPTSIRNGNRRESYMTDHFTVNLCDQGNSESVGGSQRLDYEMLCLVADRMILKRGSCDIGYCLDIRLCFITDNHIHGNNLLCHIDCHRIRRQVHSADELSSRISVAGPAKMVQRPQFPHLCRINGSLASRSSALFSLCLHPNSARL